MLQKKLAATAALALTALALSACNAQTPSASGNETASESAVSQNQGEAAAAFPVTIEHALGKTVIESEPRRVATVGWANQEVALALGIVPVGMAKVTWGDDDKDGILPWVEDKISELGGQTPALWDETDGINFEAVAASEPDVILAAYSGLTAEEYEKLSQIAPVVAYPEVPWGTSYQDMIRLGAQALGRSEEGEKLVATLEAQTQEELGKHPKLQQAKVLFTYIDPADFSQVGFYTAHDTRPGFLLDAGLPEAQILSEESAKTKEFYVTVSAEQADRFADVDLFITYGDPGSDLVERLQADPLLGKIPAVQKGQIAVLENDTPLSAMANPGPLSLPWGLDRYLAILSENLPA